MDPAKLRALLDDVSAGKVSADAAVDLLKSLPFEDLGFAKVDQHRSLRTGFPEVIYGATKSAEQIVEIARSLRNHSHNVLITRLNADKAELLRRAFPEATYSVQARVATLIHTPPSIIGCGKVLIVAAGTADLAVAEEAAITAELLGNRVERISDVGVSGIHRLLAHHEQVRDAAVLVVVAGMEGALPSVVAGLVDKPVIAVPTSVGYGASFGGLAALLAMLNSCAAGVTVVNIDNGFGAAVAASLINRG
ncbi:MAG: nickel pincer cofactor biosynthesis protein LarB [Deltaproteobacteria bacterium]|nr:nickel pincer cofactor biosynthesis protein LarB [Deltaproteobacteria bacterium]